MFRTPFQVIGDTIEAATLLCGRLPGLSDFPREQRVSELAQARELRHQLRLLESDPLIVEAMGVLAKHDFTLYVAGAKIDYRTMNNIQQTTGLDPEISMVALGLHGKAAFVTAFPARVRAEEGGKAVHTISVGLRDRSLYSGEFVQNSLERRIINSRYLPLPELIELKQHAEISAEKILSEVREFLEHYKAGRVVGLNRGQGIWCTITK